MRQGIGGVCTAALVRRGSMAARSWRLLQRYSNSAGERGTCFCEIERQVPVIAALMLPSAVLTRLKAGVRAAAAAEPVLVTSWRHPASATAAKQARPPLATWQSGCRLRLAKPEMARPQKLITRRSFRRTGLPSSAVSTAATKGVLPGEPRPRLPPGRSPPGQAPSGSTRPCSGWAAAGRRRAPS